MNKSEITPEQKRMLEELAKSLPPLVLEVQERLKGVNAVQQKIAAHISMLQAYGWEIPHLEGITIQQLSPEAAQALMNAEHPQPASGAPNPQRPIVVQPATAAVAKPERLSARKLVRLMLQDVKEMSVSALREKIQQEYGQSLAVPTVYRILAEEAEQAGEGKWKLKK